MNRRHLAPFADRAGYTLVELIVALVILGILTGMAAPRMTGLLTRNRLDQAANQVVGDVAYARMVAVRAGQRVNVEFFDAGYRIARADAAEVTKVVDLAREHPGMRLEVREGESRGVPGTLTFDSRGVLRQGEGLRVVLRRDDQAAVLEITVAGKVERAK
jgi:type II secretion system protein H